MKVFSLLVAAQIFFQVDGAISLGSLSKLKTAFGAKGSGSGSSSSEKSEAGGSGKGSGKGISITSIFGAKGSGSGSSSSDKSKAGKTEAGQMGKGSDSGSSSSDKSKGDVCVAYFFPADVAKADIPADLDEAVVIVKPGQDAVLPGGSSFEVGAVLTQDDGWMTIEDGSFLTIDSDSLNCGLEGCTHDKITSETKIGYNRKADKVVSCGDATRSKPSLNEYPNCPKFDAKRIFSDGKGYSCSLEGQEHLGKESCEKLKGKFTKDEKASCGEMAWYLKHMGEKFGEQHEGYFKSVCCTLPVAKICPDSRPKFKAQSLFSEGTEWYCSIPGKHELAKPACEEQEGVWIKAEKTSCTDLKTWMHIQGDKAKMYRVDFIAKCCESEKDKVTQKPKPKPATEPQKCQKCSGHTCDYWAEKENYSCKSLKNHYGCNCGGCECKLDKEVDECKADKCHGRTCVDWATNSKVSCSILKDLFQCTCKGCNCPKEEDDGKKKCSDHNLKGDGYCDDENNVESCDYDGGDCCHTPGKDNPQQFIYCDACECADPNGKKSPRKCRLPKYQGDDHCDDGNNKDSCDWDGGDCCGPTVNTKYCTDCLCVDPEYKGSRCISKHMGDGFCDDANNNIKCAWDEGDCCNNHHVGQFRYCTDCKCLDPKVHEESNCSGKCGSDSHKGDQFCDDDNNNCACDWDGGDCCGKNGNVYQYKYCFQCACMDPNFVAPKCPIGKFKGDGVCDDDNNIAACDFDGGDCCKKSTNKDQFNFCTKCECLE